MVLCGTKCDDIPGRQVSRKQGLEKAQKWEIPFVECSSLKCINIRELVDQICCEDYVFRRKDEFMLKPVPKEKIFQSERKQSRPCILQ